jgi:hypothetical protein
MFGLFIKRHGVACGQLQLFLYTQAADRELPGEGAVIRVARQHDPQPFPTAHTGYALFYTSNPHGHAQLTSTSATTS